MAKDFVIVYNMEGWIKAIHEGKNVSFAPTFKWPEVKVEKVDLNGLAEDLERMSKSLQKQYESRISKR